MTEETKKPRGFAALTPERRAEIARLGGSSVPKEKRSFFQNRELASTSGRKGGLNTPAEKRSFNNKELAAAAGRKGGLQTARRPEEVASE